jgi:hypothetical protein
LPLRPPAPFGLRGASVVRRVSPRTERRISMSNSAKKRAAARSAATARAPLATQSVTLPRQCPNGASA